LYNGKTWTQLGFWVKNDESYTLFNIGEPGAPLVLAWKDNHQRFLHFKSFLQFNTVSNAFSGTKAMRRYALFL
jgi:hypothetical protein